MNVENREAAWAAVHEASTPAETLAEIAAAHPEFAGAIAQHPRAYPALREWALGVEGAAHASAAVLVAEPAPEPYDAYEPAVYSAAPVAGTANEAVAVMALATTPRDSGLWRAVLVIVIAVPIVEALVLFTVGYSAYQLMILLGLAAPVMAAIAAGVSGTTTGRKVGGIALAIAAAVIVLSSVVLPGIRASGLDVIGPLVLAMLFLSWAVARPLRGAGYAALPVIVVLSILFGLSPFLLYGLAGNWQVAQLWSVVVIVLAAVIVPVVGVLLARTWSRMSERRARPRSAAPVSAAPSPPAGGDRSYRTNTTAILAFIFGFFVSVVAVILGHIALSQIARTGEQGRGFAIAGLVLGYIGIAVGAILVISQVMLFSSFSSGY